MTIASVVLFILAAFGVIVFLYNQNQSLKTKLAQCLPSSASVSSPSPTPKAEIPVVTNPTIGSVVKSPLKIKGAVPAGWMNEGIFPVKLLDSKGKVIGKVEAKEIVAGSWQSGKPVEFSATLTFKNASGSGVLVLEKDNPSGVSTNSAIFEIPINF